MFHRIFVLIVLLFTLAFPVSAQTPELSPEDLEMVRVDWLEETKEGGLTMVALLGLSVALVSLVFERALALRETRMLPHAKLRQAIDAMRAGDREGLASLAKSKPSVLGRVLHVLSSGDEAPNVCWERAADLAARDMEEEENKLLAFALIAGMAPLLGLLGTMIGMIESFKLVEVFGDEGGASMLAGSISKALITTAVGLIIAMPALLAHHLFLRKTQRLQAKVEEGLEALHGVWTSSQG